MVAAAVVVVGVGSPTSILIRTGSNVRVGRVDATWVVVAALPVVGHEVEAGKVVNTVTGEAG